MSGAFIAVADREVAMKVAPINPDWVRAGAPHARMGVIARSKDGAATTALWDCTAGAFEWRFSVDETVHILEGEAIVSCPQGLTHTLKAGDIAVFPKGANTLWRVDSYVRKLAICRHPIPRPLGFSLRVINKLKSLALPQGGSPALGFGDGATAI